MTNSRQWCVKIAAGWTLAGSYHFATRKAAVVFRASWLADRPSIFQVFSAAEIERIITPAHKVAEGCIDGIKIRGSHARRN